MKSPKLCELGGKPYRRMTKRAYQRGFNAALEKVMEIIETEEKNRLRSSIHWSHVTLAIREKINQLKKEGGGE